MKTTAKREPTRPTTQADVNAAWASMTSVDATPVENTQELRDALFRAICLLDHAKPENDTDHCDVAAARELKRLRESLNQPTAKETTRRMIAAAKAKHGGKLGGEGQVDRRKFRRL